MLLFISCTICSTCLCFVSGASLLILLPLLLSPLQPRAVASNDAPINLFCVMLSEFAVLSASCHVPNRVAQIQSPQILSFVRLHWRSPAHIAACVLVDSNSASAVRCCYKNVHRSISYNGSFFALEKDKMDREWFMRTCLPCFQQVKRMLLFCTFYHKTTIGHGEVVETYIGVYKMVNT